MATVIRLMEESPEDWLYKTPDQILACRGQGHAWPKLRPGRMPKGITAERQIDGSYELISTCRDCGTERRLVTLPTGDIDFPAMYRYRHPDGYKSPKGSEITRRDCLNEEWRRLREEQEAAARFRAAQEGARAAQRA